MTREQKVQKILNSMDSWDSDTLMEYAKESMTEDLSQLNNNMLNEYYRHIYQDAPNDQAN